jgi:hypothetical protein
MSAKTRQRNNLKRKQRAAAKLRAESQKAVNAHKAMDKVMDEFIEVGAQGGSGQISGSLVDRSQFAGDGAIDDSIAQRPEFQPPVATGTRATCPKCGKSQKVTKAGTIGKHGDCPGAGMLVGS